MLRLFYKKLPLLICLLFLFILIEMGRNTVMAISGSVPVFRLYNSYDGQHLQTISNNEDQVLTTNVLLDGSVNPMSWINESPTFYAFNLINGSCPSGTVPVYRLYNNKSGEHLLTADMNEVNTLNGKNNWSVEYADNNGIAFYAQYY